MALHRPQRLNSGQTFKIITLEEPEVMLKLKPSYYSSSMSFTEVSCLEQKYNRESLESERWRSQQEEEEPS